MGGNYTLLDAAIPWQVGFQDPASPIMEGIIRFHHDRMVVLTIVTVFVTWIRVRCVIRYRSDIQFVASGNVHGTVLEIVWTILPGLILVLIAIPSFALLYSVDEIVDPSRTLKVVGHQWYWTYEYGDFSTEDGDCVTFDSYLVDQDSLEMGQLRMLEVDNRVCLPVNTHVRLIITSADVLHCWTVPSFGVKLDACPGRLNQAAVFITRPGVYFGQCSEICGVNHGFMPICVEATSVPTFLNWIEEQDGIVVSSELDQEVALEVVVEAPALIVEPVLGETVVASEVLVVEKVSDVVVEEAVAPVEVVAIKVVVNEEVVSVDEEVELKEYVATVDVVSEGSSKVVEEVKSVDFHSKEGDLV